MSTKVKRSLSPANNFNRRKTSPIRKISPIRLNLDEGEENREIKKSSPTKVRISPTHKKDYEDIEKETAENILYNYKYEIITLLINENKNKNVEYLICLDPLGNTVFIDLCDEDKMFDSNTHDMSEFSDISLDTLKKDKSIINCYKDIVKNDVYGVVLQIDENLIIMKQNDKGNVDIKCKKLKTQKTKKYYIYPLIRFEDAITDDIEEFTFLDCVQHTLYIRDLIEEKRRYEAEKCIEELIDNLNEQLEVTRKIKREYENCINLGSGDRKEYENDCYSMCKIYSDPDEGLDEEQLETYEECKKESINKNKYLNNIHSNILLLSECSKDIRKIIKNMKENYNNMLEDKD